MSEKKVFQLYRTEGADNVKGCQEICFNIGASEPLTDAEVDKLRLVLADGFIINTVTQYSKLRAENVDQVIVELGPNMNFETSWSSNLVSICKSIGLEKVFRVEKSRLCVVPPGKDIGDFIAENHDRMTECRYEVPLTTFETGVEPEAVYEIDMINGGPDALIDIPGISMDEYDRKFYYDYFVVKHNRNPTIVEIMDLNNANSEHSRHGFFKGRQIIDGQEMDKTLFQVVVGTLEANPLGSVIAFKDNSSAIEGFEVDTVLPISPGEPSQFERRKPRMHIMFTAETHNFPTGIAPFPGAETGTGGRIRDIQGTGRGGDTMAGTSGYCVGNLNISGYPCAWEVEFDRPNNLASPLDIEIGASNGASDYGNKFGEPVIQGFTRSFDMRLENGERWGFLKPIMFTGGIGQINSLLTKKRKEEKGMVIIQVGGPAYRVGFGGGAASSMLQGENKSKLDFDAVQRGNPQMEQKMNRVIRACNEMGDKTLIEVIHDQGAGGPANVLKELVEHSGGKINIRGIRVGDPSMSVLEIYVAEYQERNGFLINPENVEEFQAICDREKVGCEILGEVTGDLRFVVYDSADGTTPVDLELNEVLGGMPQKTFEDKTVERELFPLEIPENMTVRDALYNVLRLLSVGSKRFLTNKVDRAVTGLIARQQCCGPLQLPLADVAVVAQSHFGLTGGATAIGEQPIKMLVNPATGARMAVGEALTNLIWAKVDDLNQVKCSANWMWAPKLPGEGAMIRFAAEAMAEVMKPIGIAVDGGKDSLSMATKVGGETVKSPRQLVISLYGAMSDVTKVVTPDIKHPGKSSLIFIDLSGGKNRLGGSALAQTLNQIGNESPDMEDPELLRNVFLAIQELIAQGLITAGHDRSDGGLITTLLEMAFSGNCGLDIQLSWGNGSVIEKLFSEELGLVIECKNKDVPTVLLRMQNIGIAGEVIGRTIKEVRAIRIFHAHDLVLDEDMRTLRDWWEETSYQLERLQMNPDCADEEKEKIFERSGPIYHIPESIDLRPIDMDVLDNLPDKPKVAILREEGSNSDREMTSAFYAAGFEPWDVTMTDLLAGKVSLGMFRGLAAVGGFSYADVPDSAKGWAATILFNERLKEMFWDFYNRPDTFTLGICNGCQLFALIGWVPWQGIKPENQPRFVHNVSGRFESRWSTARVVGSNSIMLKDMENLEFGIHVDHGEGKLIFPDHSIMHQVIVGGMTPIVYVDDEGSSTEAYPFNPNGSAMGLAGLCSPDGRHLAMMPHPERTFIDWQCHWLPEGMKQELRKAGISPWFQMFRNAYDWCMKN